MADLTSELTSLLWVTVLTAVLWVPYILNMITTRGLLDAVGYPEDPAPMSPWAHRLKAAHYNAVENLVVFATLVLIAHAAGVSTSLTVTAANVYFWARVVHAVSYALAIPWVRTLAFAVGVGCQAAFVVALL